MIRSKVIRVVAGPTVVLVAVVACTTQVDRTGGEIARETLTLTGIDTRSNAEVQAFIDQVHEMSHGMISLELQDQWHRDSVLGEAEAIEAVRTGATSIAVIPARAWHAAGVNSFDALIAPMAVDSYAIEEAVLRDPMIDDMLTGVAPLGLTGIAIVPGPLRTLDGITRDLVTPLQLKGAKIAISPGVVTEHVMDDLGAVPVPSQFNHADISQFDGSEMQIASIQANYYDGVITSVTGNVPLWPRPLVIVGNAAAMAALTDEQRQLLAAAGRSSIAAATASQQRAESDGIQALCERGKVRFLTASPNQVRQWKDAVAPSIAWLNRDRTTRGFLARINQLRGKTATPVTAISCPDTSPGPSPVPTTAPVGRRTPIDGVYQVTISPEEALASGMTMDAGWPANIGTLRWTFAAGQFTETQAYETTQTWGSGTYSLDGPSLIMTYDNGGGSGPAADVHAYPGDQYTWKWSLYHDQLTVRWPDPTAKDYPRTYAVKPWTRLGDAPAEPADLSSEPPTAASTTG